MFEQPIRLQSLYSINRSRYKKPGPAEWKSRFFIIQFIETDQYAISVRSPFAATAYTFPSNKRTVFPFATAFKAPEAS